MLAFFIMYFGGHGISKIGVRIPFLVTLHLERLTRTAEDCTEHWQGHRRFGALVFQGGRNQFNSITFAKSAEKSGKLAENTAKKSKARLDTFSPCLLN